jgi:hypothetical protein
MRMEYESPLENQAFPNKKGWHEGQPCPILLRLFAEKLLQFAGLVHLAHDVRAADEFAVHI